MQILHRLYSCCVDVTIKYENNTHAIVWKFSWIGFLVFAAHIPTGLRTLFKTSPTVFIILRSLRPHFFVYFTCVPFISLPLNRIFHYDVPQFTGWLLDIKISNKFSSLNKLGPLEMSTPPVTLCKQTISSDSFPSACGLGFM
jgi:hypothetical protein